MPWELGALAVWSALLAGLAVTTLASGSALDVSFFIAGSTGGIFLGTVQLMKLANRRAQRRIAAGEFADFKSLGDDGSMEVRRNLTKGSAL
jgi:hypothetical protein